MSFKPRIPKSLLLGGNHTVDSHFALINYQVIIFNPGFFLKPAVFHEANS